MDYLKHYNKLIERSKTRTIKGYTEKHHIIPRCLGGGDSKSNLAVLTAEEHYVAHQLLYKIYSNEPKLLYAARMMCCKGRGQLGRSSNKLYAWMRKEYSKLKSIEQSGKGNVNYGKCWVSNLETKVSKRINKNELEKYLQEGWIKRRTINWNKKLFCECGKPLITNSKYCSKECYPKVNYKSTDTHKGREQEFINLIDLGQSVNSSLKQMGYIGAVGSHYKWAKKILSNRK